MKTAKRGMCLLLILMIVFTNLSINVFAAEKDSTEENLYDGTVATGENTIQIWSEVDDGYIGKNAISSLDNWQEIMFNLMGFASVVDGGNKGDEYFTEENTAPESTVLWFLNMTDELQGHVDVYDGYLSIGYEEYMNIAEAYFVNVPDMKDYLIRTDRMDEETEQIYYYMGGLGAEWDWILCDAQEYNEGYKLNGIFCYGGVEDTTGLTEYVDYYNGLYIESAVQLYVVENEEHGWQIAAYTELDYYKVNDDTNMGEVLYVYNEEKENFSDVYYLIDIIQPEKDLSVVLKEDTYKMIDGMYCYSSDMTVEYNVDCGEGWTCQNVIAERTLNGNKTMELWGESGTICGEGSVCITPKPLALFTIDAEYAEVEILQGLVDMGDGTYAYDQTAVIELKITPDTGFDITEVASFRYDDYVVFGQYISASGTWAISPEFCPSTIRVTTSKIPDGMISFVSGDNSRENVTVLVPEAYAEKVEGLSLVVEKLETAEEEKTMSFICKNVVANEVRIFDIYFENQQKEEVKVNATMNVTIPLPTAWAPDSIAVYYVNTETGEMIDMGAVVNEDGRTVSFTTTHFSHYALVQTESSSIKDNETEINKPDMETENDKETPKTGDDTNLTLWVGMLGVSMMVVIVTWKRRKANM